MADEWVEGYRSPEGKSYRDGPPWARSDGMIAPLSLLDVVIPVAEIFA